MNRKKTRLIVKRGDEYVTLNIKDVAFIYRSDEIIIVHDKDERKYLCDKNLSQLETELGSAMFFRANRQYLININFIRSFKVFEKVKLLVSLTIPHPEHQIIISQKSAPEFRKWISED